MTDNDLKPFLMHLVGLLEVFGGELSKNAQRLYFEALKDIPWPQLERAFKAALVQCKFLPKPAELRELAGCSAAGQALEDRIERAWQAWRAAVRTVGAYRSLYCADGATARALEALYGGWVEACRSDESPEMWASRRKEWGRVYRLYLDAPPARLAGEHERSNSLRGFDLTALTAPLSMLLLDGTTEEQPALPAAEDAPERMMPLALQPSREEAREVWERVKAEVQARKQARPRFEVVRHD